MKKSGTNSEKNQGKNNRVPSFFCFKVFRWTGLLDHDESATATCNRTMAEPYQYLDKTCNGNESFCNLKFNEFTFPGTHNSGTGMKRTVWVADCHYKNQDLDMTEMLDFGIRFFDFDTKYK